MLDAVIYESEGGSAVYDQYPFFKVDYFRITPLGAYVLGMGNDYNYEDHPTVEWRQRVW